MLKIKLPKNRVQFLVEELERRVKPQVLDRGWDYYHRGFVQNVNLVHGYVLQADVRGKESAYRTSLDLERFSRSECSCPFDGCCKHMAALVFYAYAPHGRPELLLMQMKQSILTRKRNTRSAGKSEKAAEPPSASLQPESAPKEWVRFFEQRFHGYSLSNQHSVEQFLQNVWETLGDKALEWPEPLASLYKLHLILYVLWKIDQFHQQNRSSYLSYYIENGCKIVAGQCWEKLRDLADEWPPEPSADSYPKHWKDTVSIAGEAVSRNKPGPVHWLDVYRFLWSRLLTGPEQTDKERRRLSLLLEQPHLLPKTRDGLLLAAAHFDMLAGRDEDAIKQLDMLSGKQLSDFYIVLEQLAEREEWSRLLSWLRWLLPVLSKAKQDEFNKGCAFWVEAMKHEPSDEEWIRVMLSLLPRSYYYYTDYLMKTKRYRQWVDLQLAAGVTPANLYTAEIRTVESEDPSLLLPLFHQSVEKAILEKNRDSYKLAVRQLKKLQGLYKQLGLTDRWSDYIARLSAKYARLRAFKEELAKGQWTT